MRKTLVSIIIPVYNVEKYLERCLSSILNQTFTEFEVLAINDGSTDRSLDILKQMAKNDSRLKVIHQENQGVSSARNKGLSLAKGDYIGFVDADDYIEPTMYEKLYDCAITHQCDVVVANVFDESLKSRKVSLKFETERVQVPNSCMDDFLKEHFFKFGHAVWHKLFQRELIEQYHLRFHPYQEVSSEDMVFNLSVLACARSIYYLNEPLYHYVIHENSLTKSYHAKYNMISRCKRSVRLVEQHYNTSRRMIPVFIEYLTYTELLRGLAHTELSTKSLKEAIKKYSELQTFQPTMKRLAFSSQLNEYFVNEKGSYSKLYREFDRLFSWLCLCHCYDLAASLHAIRIKRATRFIEEAR